jgi:hypothetical protein
VLTHVVLIQLDDKTTIDEVVRRARSLQSDIDVIVDMEVGRDVVFAAPSYDVAMIVRFRDQEALASYSQHPAHKAFSDFVHAIGDRFAAVAFNEPTARPAE